MSYRPAEYSDPVSEEMERIFGLDPELRRLALAKPRKDRSKRVPSASN